MLHLPRVETRAFTIENERILTDLEEMEIAYTARVEDLSFYTPAFKGALIMRLAVSLATPTQCDATTRDRAIQLYQIKLMEAITQDMKQRVDVNFSSQRWVEAR